MNQRDIQIYIKLLRMTKDLIKSRHDDYICHALSRLALRHHPRHCSSLQIAVQRKIRPCYTVDSWVKDQTKRDCSRIMGRRVRIKWIDESIRALQEKLK